jgi:hypothetical protein
MLTIKLQGGLGNQLFQLSFLDYISKITGKEKYICELQSPSTLHSQNQYYETIFQEWKSLYKNIPATIIHEHPHMIKQEWITHTGNTCYIGYFQRYEYMDLIRDEFISKLKFNTLILEKYPEISKKVFIHIRGGDYKNNGFHELNLKNYYSKCLKLCKNEEFVIFTNDIPYAKEYFKDIPIIEESELDSLYLMSKAKGCICTNSSFSWWGAYLNPNRPIFMPSKWFNDASMRGNYYFKGVQVIEV